MFGPMLPEDYVALGYCLGAVWASFIGMPTQTALVSSVVVIAIVGLFKIVCDGDRNDG